MPEFDYQGAKSAGWNDDDIADFLTTENKKGKGLFVSKEATQAMQPSPGFFERVKEGIGKRAERVGEISDVYGAGKQTLAESALQVTGQAVAGLSDIGFEALKSAGKAVGFTLETEATQRLLKSPVAQSGLAALRQGAEAYKTFKEKNPRVAANLEAVMNIGQAIPAERGLALGGKAVQKAGQALPSTKQVLQKPAEVIQRTKEVLAGIDTPTKNVLDPAARTKEALKKEVSKKRLTPQEAREIAEEVRPRFQQQAQAGKARVDFYLSKAARASKDASQPTPLELVGKRAEDAVAELNKKLNRYGDLKQKALGDAAEKSVSGIDNLKLKLLDTLDSRLGVYIDAKGKIVSSPGKVSKIELDASDQGLLTKVYTILDNLDDVDSVARVDATVDAIQNLLYKRQQNVFIPINNTTEGLLKKTIGELNGLVKKEVGEDYIRANQKYANVIDLRDTLNKALGKEGTKGGALMKRVFSPADAGTKAMFKKIHDITGINLTDEAVFAKYAMEAVGDARQKSLLEEVGVIRGAITGGGLVGTAQKTLEFLLTKTQTKEKVGKEIIERAIKK